MPRKNPDGSRDYSYDKKYEKTPKQHKANEERTQARRILSKEGKVTKFDSRDVDHIKPVSKGGTNSRSNLRAISASANRAKGNRSK